MPSVIDIPTYDPLLPQKDTAAMLGVEESTLVGWRYHKRYNLPYIKIGKLIRYRKSDVLAFIDFCAHGGIDDEVR